MIIVDLALQVIVCTVCHEPKEIPRSLLRDQHSLLELEEATKRDHRECAASPNDVAKAMRDRAYRKRMERELAKAAGKGPTNRRRCNGK